jgi:hypothetical protein
VLYTPRVLRINLSIQTNYFKDFNIIWLLNILDMSVPDEGYSRNVPDEGYSRNVPDEAYSERTC